MGCLLEDRWRLLLPMGRNKHLMWESKGKILVLEPTGGCAGTKRGALIQLLLSGLCCPSEVHSALTKVSEVIGSFCVTRMVQGRICPPWGCSISARCASEAIGVRTLSCLPCVNAFTFWFSFLPGLHICFLFDKE